MPISNNEEKNISTEKRGTLSGTSTLFKEKTSNPSWNIPTLNMVSLFLTQKEKNSSKNISTYNEKNLDTYTILNDKSIVYRGMMEIAELYNATHISPRNLAAFRPERIAWHQTIIAITTKIQIKDEEDLYAKVFYVYEKALSQISQKSSLLEKKKMEIEQFIAKMVDDIKEEKPLEKYENIAHFKEIKEQYLRLKATEKEINPGEFIKDYTIERIVTALWSDKIYSEEANRVMGDLLERTVESLIENHTYKALIIPKAEERITFLVAGGPASGKGSSVAQLIYLAEEQGIDWDNVVKINTDTFKPLLLEPGTTTPELYSQLAHDEGAVIHGAIQTKLKVMAKNKLAPHIFADQVQLDPEKLTLAFIEKGQAIAIIVSTDVESAIERSYARGLKKNKKGRYEATQSLLLSHQTMTTLIPQRLKENLGNPLFVRIVDNNVPEDFQPDVVLDLDLLSNKGVLYDKKKLERFIQKVKINPYALNPNDLYTGEASQWEEYLKPVIEQGMIILPLPKATSINTI